MNEMGLPKEVNSIYVINLDRSKDRMSGARNNLQKLGLPYTRWPAIDGSLLGDVDLDIAKLAYSCANLKRINDKSIKAWAGCLRSHASLMKHVLENWRGPTLVLEDDARLKNEWHTILTNSLDTLGDKECELMLLHAHRPTLSLDQKRSLVAAYSTAAYLVRSRDAAKDLCRIWGNANTEADLAWWVFMQRGTTFHCSPNAAYLSGQTSTIQC